MLGIDHSDFYFYDNYKFQLIAKLPAFCRHLYSLHEYILRGEIYRYILPRHNFTTLSGICQGKLDGIKLELSHN